MRSTLPFAFAAVLSAALTQSGCEQTPQQVQAPPPKVSVGQPEVRQIVDSDDYNGWLQPAETVEVRARVRGHLDKIHFVDGDLVRKGQLLFELDPRPFQAEIDRTRDQVRIFEAQATAATKEEARLKDLVKKGGASQSQVDAAEAESKSLQAQIEATKQEVARKALDLEYSRITAPISGRISRALLSVGNLVNAGATDPVLTTIVSVDPIYLYFNVDERSLQRYMKSRSSTSRPASVRDAKLPLVFALETDEGFPHSGVIDFADNKVDPQTGTIQLRAVVPNPKGTFIPGSRAKIRVPVSDQHPALLLPDTAVLTDQDKKYVLTVDDKNVVHRKDVELGKLLDDGTRVVRPARSPESGLTPADWVVVQGLQTARVNYPVEPVRPAPTSQPTAAAR
jgi:RND family efflux transporter MFP subunit